MRKNILFALMMLSCVLLLSVDARAASLPTGLFKSIERYGDDVAKLGKQLGKGTLKQIDDLVKRYPSLAGKSKDVLKGAILIEKTAQKSPAASRLIGAGINPATIVIAAERNPGRLKLGDEIAELFSRAKGVKPPANLPAPAVNAMRKLDGNYTGAGESFFEMAKRGGQKAVDTAEELLKATTPGKVGAGIAAGLLAWHLVDPEGAEQAIHDFFKEHVAPIVSAPIEGLGEAAAEGVNNTLETAANSAEKIANKALEISKKHWFLLAFLFSLIILWKVPNLRKLPFTLLNNFFGKVISKVDSSTTREKPINHATPSATQNQSSSRRINIYGKK